MLPSTGKRWFLVLNRAFRAPCLSLPCCLLPSHITVRLSLPRVAVSLRSHNILCISFLLSVRAYLPIHEHRLIKILHALKLQLLAARFHTWIHGRRYPSRSLPSRESQTGREFRSSRESGIRRDGSERREGLAAAALIVMVVVLPVVIRARVGWS